MCSVGVRAVLGADEEGHVRRATAYNVGRLVEMRSWVVAVTFAGLPVSTLLGCRARPRCNTLSPSEKPTVSKEGLDRDGTSLI